MLGFLLGLAAWWQAGHVGWVIGAVLLIANWPVTFFVIMPTNNRLMATDPAAAGTESQAMIERWGSLHAVRTALGFAACLAFLWHPSLEQLARQRMCHSTHPHPTLRRILGQVRLSALHVLRGNEGYQAMGVTWSRAIHQRHLQAA